MNKKAVIGTCISGISIAQLLKDRYEVSFFESAELRFLVRSSLDSNMPIMLNNDSAIS